MKIFLEYEVTTSFIITLERNDLPEDHQDLLDSVTRQELLDAPMEVNELEWGHLKDAWRCATPENTWVYDEDRKELFLPINL